jgi:hypothetical protein
MTASGESCSTSRSRTSVARQRRSGKGNAPSSCCRSPPTPSPERTTQH